MELPDNYELLHNGVIHQKTIVNKIKDYNPNYVDERYNSYGEKGMQMAYLRYSFLVGCIDSTIAKILDVGYGNGDFLKVCSEGIDECYGNDVSNYPLPENVGFVSDITDKEYDVICFFDSLEHFEDINFVRDLKTEYIYISLPNCHYHSADWFLNWKHRREDEHLYHFNIGSLIDFMAEQGYGLVRISEIEDIIRKPTTDDNNILTGLFQKL